MYLVYPASVNYTFLYQRPQQLMRCFGWAGYDCIYASFCPATLEGSTPVTEPMKVSENLLVVPDTHDLEPYQDGIFYCTYPPYMKVRDIVNPEVTIFDSIDEPVGVFSHWNKNNIYEKALMDADIVLASADKLYKNAKEYNKNTILVPNGCDFEHFSKYQAEPKALRHIKRPRITFTGALATWLDNELIYETARQFPNCEIVLVGPVYDGRYENPPKNIHFLGHQPYRDMPGYLHNSDVLIIPFDTENPVIEATNPIKLWEYLATGKPIVTTNIPEVTMTDCVTKAKNWDQFFWGIKQALIFGQPPDKKRKCIQYARKNSWKERCNRILAKVDELL